MKELAIFIDGSQKTPVYEQIYEFLKKDIAKGHLKAGTFLPSTRALANYLQLSRSTVLMAYDQLIAEGYIESRPKRGYCVLETEELYQKSPVEFVADRSEKPTSEKLINFAPEGIETEHFPVLEWKRIAKQVLSKEELPLFDSGDYRGDPGLRRILAKYLRESRGVHADPERIIIGSGNENLLMILNMVLGPNRVYAMENPVYQKSYKILQGLGCTVLPISMDRSGIDMEELGNSSGQIAYVTPSHQYPLGIVMTIRRRMELLSWAQQAEGRYIIEDDYDSEFRFKGKPIPSLQNSDSHGKVIYIGTFSKSVSPAIRISYMVLPPELFETYEKNLRFFSNTVSRIDQKILEIFMESGGFERHLNRMRTIYKNKHDQMLGELKTWNGIDIFGEHAGAHMLIRIRKKVSEEELVAQAKAAGVQVYHLSSYYIGKQTQEYPVIILGFAKLSADKILEGLGILKKIWKIN